MHSQPPQGETQQIESLQQRLLRRKQQIRIYCSNCRTIVFNFHSHIKGCIQKQREDDITYLNKIKTFPYPVANKRRLSIWKYSFDPVYQEEVRKERVRFQKQNGRESVIKKLRLYTGGQNQQTEPIEQIERAQDLSITKQLATQ